MASLTDRKQLTVHSGLVTNAVLPLLNAGVISLPDRCSRPSIVTNAFVGTATLYEQADNDGIEFANVGFTHALTTLVQLPNFVSI
ncbi:MAG: hypothetical protein J0653_06120, partial [Deltaproteobacteria bacterium]|nr:hypothetical protein [Deltaproteobacteria bacterium]